MSGKNTMTWAILGGIAFLFVVGCIIRFGLFGGMMFNYGMGFGMMGSGFGWMGFGMILFGLLVLAGFWFIFSGYRPHGFNLNDGALAIARERFARGEITKEEFERIRKDLE
jgi:putative membrane protein